MEQMERFMDFCKKHPRCCLLIGLMVAGAIAGANFIYTLVQYNKNVCQSSILFYFSFIFCQHFCIIVHFIFQLFKAWAHMNILGVLYVKPTPFLLLFLKLVFRHTNVSKHFVILRLFLNCCLG